MQKLFVADRHTRWRQTTC